MLVVVRRFGVRCASAVRASWMLAAGCFDDVSCCLLLYCWLLPFVAGRCLVFVVCCCLRFVVVCWCSLFDTVVVCCLLAGCCMRCAAVCCYLMDDVVVCCLRCVVCHVLFVVWLFVVALFVVGVGCCLLVVCSCVLFCCLLLLLFGDERCSLSLFVVRGGSSFAVSCLLPVVVH